MRAYFQYVFTGPFGKHKLWKGICINIVCTQHRVKFRENEKNELDISRWKKERNRDEKKGKKENKLFTMDFL